MATREKVYEILQDIEFTCLFRRGPSGLWIAYCEEVPEARTQGETKEEVEENLRDAISFILEDRSTEELEGLREWLMSAQREQLTL